MTRALFTGDREWKDTYIVDLMIGGLESMVKGFPSEELVIIEGEARGLDRTARIMAEARHRVTVVERYSVDTSIDGPWPAAGVRRNQRMLDQGRPQVVFAFHNDLPNSRGTLDMCERSLRSGLPVYHVRALDRDVIKVIRRYQKEQRARR